MIYNREGRVAVFESTIMVDWRASFQRVDDFLTLVTCVRDPYYYKHRIMHARIQTFYDVGIAYIIDLEHILCDTCVEFELKTNQFPYKEFIDTLKPIGINEIRVASSVFADTQYIDFDAFKMMYVAMKSAIHFDRLKAVFSNELPEDILHLMTSQYKQSLCATPPALEHPFKIKARYSPILLPFKFCIVGLADDFDNWCDLDCVLLELYGIVLPPPFLAQ